MDLPLGLVVSSALALLGYLITYVINVKLGQRADRLLRVNEQLEKLFGPLRMLDIACFQGITPLAKRCHLDWLTTPEALIELGKLSEEDPESLVASEYMYVVKETVLPNATKIMEIVRENASLFDGYVPEWTYELECHVAEFAYIVHTWDTTEANDDKFVCDSKYPTDLMLYVKKEFQRLKVEQRQLLTGIDSDVSSFKDGKTAVRRAKLVADRDRELGIALVHMDTTGDGIADTVGVDTTGDGKVNVMRDIEKSQHMDTTGDGHADTVGMDTTGDGKIDVMMTSDDGERLKFTNPISECNRM